MNSKPGLLSKLPIKHFLPNVGTVILLALFLWVQSASAFPFRTPQGPADIRISYQGRLAGADGVPLAGAYEMTFALYTDASGGSPIWSETHASVAVNDGLFSVLLGSVADLPDPMPAGNLYLGITVGGEEITPRSLLSSSYHALEANVAATVADGAVGTAQLADGAVTVDKLIVEKYSFGYPANNPIFYKGPSGQQTTLDPTSCPLDDWCCNADNSLCYFHTTDQDSILEFSLAGAPSVACVLLHEEDDWPSKSKGIYYATDSGNQCHMNSPCARLSREGDFGSPIEKETSYDWLCGW